MVSTGKFVCVTHRTVNVGGHSEEQGCRVYSFGSKWRPPKKRDDKAWALIERGEYWWDEKALANVPEHLLDYRYESSRIPRRFRKRNKSAEPRQKPGWQRGLRIVKIKLGGKTNHVVDIEQEW